MDKRITHHDTGLFYFQPFRFQGNGLWDPKTDNLNTNCLERRTTMTTEAVKTEVKPAGVSPEEFTKLQEKYKNLESVLGRQGQELGNVRSLLSEKEEMLAQQRADAEAAKLEQARSGKLQEYETNIKAVNGKMADIRNQIAELDVTDPDFTKSLADLQGKQADLQDQAFQLAQAKAREETFELAKNEFSKTLSERDKAADDRTASQIAEDWKKEEPEFNSLSESGELDPIIEAGKGFYDPPLAYYKLHRDRLKVENADLKRRLALATGESLSGDVITGDLQGEQVKTPKKPGSEKELDAGMLAALRASKVGTG